MKILNAIRSLFGFIALVIGGVIFQIGFSILPEDMQIKFAYYFGKHMLEQVEGKVKK